MAYPSIIGSSVVIRGNVRGDTSLEILGRVEGDVGVTGDLSLGRDAVVIGTVSGARITIAGSVEGNVSGTEAVVISETGRVVGDVSAPRLGMSEGAHVRGSVRTEGNGAASAAPAARAPAQRERTQEARSTAPTPIERPAPRPIAVPAPSQQASNIAPKPLAKKEPPPPVIHAPRPGARARKKLSRR